MDYDDSVELGRAVLGGLFTVGLMCLALSLLNG